MNSPLDHPTPISDAVAAPAWCVSFADMSLLLLSFFVMMLTTTNPEVTKNEDLLKILAAIKLGFGYEPTNNAKDRLLDAEVVRLLAEKEQGSRAFPPVGPSVSQAAVAGKRLKQLDEAVRERGALGGPVLFERHSAVIDPVKRQFFQTIGESLGLSRTVVVIGHCSPDEALTARDGGFELAYQRASNLRDVLVIAGVPPTRIRLVSCASSETQSESESPVQRRAIVTLGQYYVPSQRLAAN